MVGICFGLGVGIAFFFVGGDTPPPEPTQAVEEAIPSAPLPAEPPRPLPVAVEIAVQINATPWANIHIDGEEAGVTPLSGVLLPEGAHVFEAHFPDGRVERRKTLIDAQNRFVAFE